MPGNSHGFANSLFISVPCHNSTDTLLSGLKRDGGSSHQVWSAVPLTSSVTAMNTGLDQRILKEEVSLAMELLEKLGYRADVVASGSERDPSSKTLNH
jgi:hypothetical protein